MIGMAGRKPVRVPELDGFAARLEWGMRRVDLWPRKNSTLAERARVDGAWLTRVLKSGTVPPGVEFGMVVRLANALGLTIGWLGANQGPQLLSSLDSGVVASDPVAIADLEARLARLEREHRGESDGPRDEGPRPRHKRRQA